VIGWTVGVRRKGEGVAFEVREIWARFHNRMEASNVAWWFLVAYVLLLPVQFRTLYGFRFAPSDLCLVTFLVFSLRRLVIRRHSWSVWHAGVLAMFLWGLLVALLRTGHITTYALVNKTLGILVLFSLYVGITSRVKTWPEVRFLLRVFVINVVIHTGFALTVFLVGLRSGHPASWINYAGVRLSGFLVNPNAFGGLLAVALAIQLGSRCWKRPLLPGYLGLACEVVLAGGLVLTYSRSAWLAFLAVLVCLIVFRPRVAIRAIGVAGLALALVVVALGGEHLGPSVKIAMRSAHDRIVLAEAAIERVWKSPVLGIGTGVFLEEPIEEPIKEWVENSAGSSIHMSIHNTLLWALVEFGGVGLLVMVGFLLWFVVCGVKSYPFLDNRQKCLLLSLLLAHAAMGGLSLGIEAFYQRHWWYVMGLLGTVPAMCRRKRQSATTSRLALRQTLSDFKRGLAELWIDRKASSPQDFG